MKNNIEKKRLLIAGGGIIGVTLAREAALSGKFTKITIIEKEKALGTHASTRNSGVIHAGFYYNPDSKKAKFCSKGNELMRNYCMKNKLNVNKCGKVVVTRNASEEETLFKLYKRGINNGCEIKFLNKKSLKGYEPLASTYENFLWSPNTWSASPNEVFSCLLKECKELGIEFIINEKITSASINSVKSSKNKRYFFEYFVNSAGGFSLELSKLFGIKTNFSIIPFKGLYLKSVNKIRNFSRHIYPVPNLQQPFLGIHTTNTFDDYLKLGPTALPALSPENYSIFEGLDWKLSSNIILKQLHLFLKNEFGFRELAYKEIKYLNKENIIRKANELTNYDLSKINFNWHSPGIRPQLYNENNKRLENDFIIIGSNNTFHILNSISPAWSSAFMSAKYIMNKIMY